MAAVERFREPVSSVSFDILQKRIQEGWRLVALEWERPSEMGEDAGPVQQAPFGSRVISGALGLEENPAEMQVLFRMMGLIIEEVPYSCVAAELNRAGFRTRTGREWSPTSVFEMLPRLIEVGPAIFSSEEWPRRKRAPMSHGN